MSEGNHGFTEARIQTFKGLCADGNENAAAGFLIDVLNEAIVDAPHDCEGEVQFLEQFTGQTIDAELLRSWSTENQDGFTEIAKNAVNREMEEQLRTVATT